MDPNETQVPFEEESPQLPAAPLQAAAPGFEMDPGLFGMDPALFAALPQIGELAAQWPNDSWEAVKQLEAALESVRQGVELQLQEIETDTSNLEELCEDMRLQVAGMSPEIEGLESMRSLLVCYFPREANKEMIRTAFAKFGTIDSVYLVHKDGKPACYGFVNFADHHSAVAAMHAAASKEIVLVDKRNEKWCVKAEWTKSADIPKKPKKKRSKKQQQQEYGYGSPMREELFERLQGGSPPLPLSPGYGYGYGDWGMGYSGKGYRNMGYPQQYGSPYKAQALPRHIPRFERPLSYSVSQPSGRTGQQYGSGVAVS